MQLSKDYIRQSGVLLVVLSLVTFFFFGAVLFAVDSLGSASQAFTLLAMLCASFMVATFATGLAFFRRAFVLPANPGESAKVADQEPAVA